MSQETTRRTARRLALDDESADRVFKALAARPRRQILGILAAEAAGECCQSPEGVCACVFSERLGIGAPTVSHHMKVLAEAGLVTAEKRGLWVHYALRADQLAQLTNALADLVRLADDTP